MTTVKSLAVIALLFGGTSLAVAQSGPATGSQPPVSGGAAGNPAAPGPGLQTGTRTQHATKHHKKMFMSTTSTHKRKHMKMAPTASSTKQ